MKLADWLNVPNADGSRKRRRDLAARVRVHPSMITAYADGTAWPARDRWAAIALATGGEVSPHDHLPDEARELIEEARRCA